MAVAAGEEPGLLVLVELDVKQMAEVAVVERGHLPLVVVEVEQHGLLAGEHRELVEVEAQVLDSGEVVEEQRASDFQQMEVGPQIWW